MVICNRNTSFISSKCVAGRSTNRQRLFNSAADASSHSAIQGDVEVLSQLGSRAQAKIERARQLTVITDFYCS